MTTESDTRLALAYAAGEQQLAALTSSMESLRTRANNILAATALFVSFAAGIGLLNTDPSKGAVLPTPAKALLLGLIVAVGVLSLLVAWPVKEWVYTTSAAKILKRRESGDDEDAIRKFVIEAMIAGARANRKKLDRKQSAFRWATILLVAEIAVLAIALMID